MPKSIFILLDLYQIEVLYIKINLIRDKIDFLHGFSSCVFDVAMVAPA